MLAILYEPCYRNRMLPTKKKQAVMKKARAHETDTGSAKVQIALLNEQIEALAAHLKKNAKDNHSRRGLLAMVAKRRTHEKYLAKKHATEKQGE